MFIRIFFFLIFNVSFFAIHNFIYTYINLQYIEKFIYVIKFIYAIEYSKSKEEKKGEKIKNLRKPTKFAKKNSEA